MTSSNRLVRLQSCEKAMGWCTAQCENHCERVTQFWTSPSEEEEVW